ncbi:hypothetical protein P8452_55977 [Trifolium repens]|nr:hypothetical protein P8452_55977 [Trifolium repens]
MRCWLESKFDISIDCISVHAETTKVLTSISLSHKLIPGHASTTEHATIQLLHLEPKPVHPVTERPGLWKSPTVAWIKANTYGTMTHASAAYGALFRDYTSRFLGGYTQRVNGTVLHTELMSMILAMELAHREANRGHSFVDLKWWNSMPLELRDVALHDMLGLPSYHFD